MDTVTVIDIGEPQQRIRIWLKRGGALVFRFINCPFPADTTVTLTIGNHVASAVVGTDTVSWRIEPEDVDPIKDGADVRIVAVFPDEPKPTPVPWLKGVVRRDD